MSASARRPRLLATTLATTLAAAALSMIAGCKCASEPAPAAALAQLALVEGSVSLERAGEPRPAKLEPLWAGDVVITGAPGWALVRFADGNELELGEQARFVVRGSPVQLELEVVEGVVTYRGRSGGKTSSITLLTPFGINRLGGEAEATIGVGRTGAVIEVSTGEITFVSRDGKPQAVSAGEKLEVTLGTVVLSRPGDAPDAGLEPDAGAAPAAQIVLAPIEFAIEPEGEVRLKAAGEKRAKLVRKGQQVAAGSEVLVGKKSKASLVAPGLGVRLDAGARAKVGEASREGSSERYQLSLGGDAQLLLEKGERELVLDLPQGELRVRSAEESTLHHLSGRGGGTLQVQAGEVELSLGGASRRVKAGEAVALRPGLAEVAVKGGLRIASRARVSVHTRGNGPSSFTLDWPANGAPVQLQVARDSGFEELIVSGRIAGSSATLPAPRSGTLHWRVRDEQGAELRAGQIRFQPESAYSTGKAAPHNEIAETGLKAMVYFQSALPSLGFSFPAVEGAQQYRLRVYRASAPQAPLLERLVTQPRCELKAGALGEGSYLWYVSALGNGGAELSGGRMNKLEIAYDNTTTELVVERPRDGERVGAEVQVAGIAPLGSKVFVNDRPVVVAANGRFEQKLPAAPTLVFRLVAGGVEHYWTRSLRTR